MNLPNLVTSFRILVSLTAPFFLVINDFWVRVTVGFICVIAVLTDWFDGWYARKYNQVSTTGKILDPIADKVYIIATFSVLAYLDLFSIWWVIPIFLREIVITAYRLVFLTLGKAVAAVSSGKIKTVAQISSIGLIYFCFMWKTYYSAYYHPALDWLILLSLVVSLYLTLYSGYIFFQNNWKMIKSYHSSNLAG